jgi:hypothetical protein
MAPPGFRSAHLPSTLRGAFDDKDFRQQRMVSENRETSPLQWTMLR